MKVLIAGGGTGGHLFPGIAVAEELRERGHHVSFVGTTRGIEARVCPREQFEIDFIEVSGLKGTGMRLMLRGLFKLPRALWQSLSILRRRQPDIVIGVGGYASGPMVLAASMSGRPTVILEQNSVPGITNRILGKVVKRVFGAFENAQSFFPSSRYRLVGNPVRRTLRALGPKSSADKSLLVVGGSQGAHAVNELMFEAMKILKAQGRSVRLTHQTGQADFADLEQRYREAGLTVDVRAFIDDMGQAYRSAGLAVTRAGASTLAELTTLGVPSILIPFPAAADDHQTKNARELEAHGAARVLLQKETAPAELASTIGALLDDDVGRHRMAEAAQKAGRPEAHRVIADEIEQLVSS